MQLLAVPQSQGETQPIYMTPFHKIKFPKKNTDDATFHELIEQHPTRTQTLKITVYTVLLTETRVMERRREEKKKEKTNLQLLT